MSSLVLKGVGKRFGGLQAVAPFDMEIARGKITGLIGPNGAGKTTVVNLITGVYKLSQGSIRFGEIDLTEAPRHEVARAGLARTYQTIPASTRCNGGRQRHDRHVPAPEDFPAVATLRTAVRASGDRTLS